MVALAAWIAGACALFLVPLQFSERLRRRYTVLHRTIGGIYVTGVFVLGPIGVYIQFLDEGQGASRSFTIETVMQSGLLMVTTGIGLYFALKRMFYTASPVDDPQLCGGADIPRNSRHLWSDRPGSAFQLGHS